MESLNLNTVLIHVDGAVVVANLSVPENAKGIVLFSHGSGSGRLSPRNRYVAEVLNKAGMATLLTDLLTKDEDRYYQSRFDISLLTKRLVGITKWVYGQPNLKDLGVAYFGASTGAASAIRAAVHLKDDIVAVVSRGGRPDLAAEALREVEAPTLLIVGSLDGQVIDLNRAAYNLLECPKKMEIIQGATHLFEEPGKLDEVSKLASDWFNKYFEAPHETSMKKLAA
jgi:putative phosphoribosyl transferase